MRVELPDVAPGLWLGPAPSAREDGDDWDPLGLRGDSTATDVTHRARGDPPPGSEPPGGLLACHDGRGMEETPVYLPEPRALVFADGMTAPDGELRVWGTPWHEQRVLPALRALLELPFEHVIVSHGELVHDRPAFEAPSSASPGREWKGA